MTPFRITLAALAFTCLAMAFFPATARAQHSDWLLGSYGLNGAAQPPEGIYYQNIWSYYQASGSGFIQTGLKSGPLGGASSGNNLSASGSLKLFVDQNIVAWTAPLKILGANYGCFIDLPFAIVAASGDASLQANLSLPRGSAVAACIANLRRNNQGQPGRYLRGTDQSWLALQVSRPHRLIRLLRTYGTI